MPEALAESRKSNPSEILLPRQIRERDHRSQFHSNVEDRPDRLRPANEFLLLREGTRLCPQSTIVTGFRQATASLRAIAMHPAQCEARLPSGALPLLPAANSQRWCMLSKEQTPQPQTGARASVWSCPQYLPAAM